MKHGWRWYWHRLKAMRPDEFRERVAQRMRQREDMRRLPPFLAPPVGPAAAGAWPVLPPREIAPESLVASVRQHAAEILAGDWLLFGHLRVKVDDPPRWFMDAQARKDLPTGRHGFRLNHRELPPGCDIKVLWEISRWQAVGRLAQSAWLNANPAASAKVAAWLADWVRKNPPYYGWNWTSALEAGMRLMNFAWIDALLEAAGSLPSDWAAIRQRVLPAHAWFTWRHRSYGSSANNHLLGELAGLLLAVTRWPVLTRWCTSRGELARLWEREVLAQFAEDGGNQEQALSYQLFAWELCWHTRGALRAAGHPVSEAVEERLRRAADFFVTVQTPSDRWDYGDSDSALAVPLGESDTDAAGEWYRWLADAPSSPVLRWWLGEPPTPVQPPACVGGGGDWLIFAESGHATSWSGAWQARWDLSPLGYLSTAAHGHLDALHLSLWLNGVAVVIDPGTGAYYGDTRLRAYLASWRAHNGPHVPGATFPNRLGPFLWGNPHARPVWTVVDEQTLEADLLLPHGRASRQVRRVKDEGRDGWQVDDLFEHSALAGRRWFQVRWQFPPGTRLVSDPANPRLLAGGRAGVSFEIGVDAAWSTVEVIPPTEGSIGFPVKGDLEGLCSSSFRRVESGPVLVLTAHGESPTRYRTTFLAATH